MPRVSVIMPVYNAETFIDISVESVISQSYQDWELIIINDGSSDSSAVLCDRWASSDGRIKVIHRSNSGVSSARNCGIAASCGEFVAFLDADDSYEPTFLQCLIDAIDSSAAECAACGHLRLYPDGHTEEEGFPCAGEVLCADKIKEEIVIPLLSDRLSANLFNGFIWRCLFRRDTIINNDIRFSGAYLEDELFLIEYFSYPTVLAVAEGFHYRYLQNPGSVTRKYLPGFVETFLKSFSAKRKLSEKFDIPVPDFWQHNTAWAGLLMAIGNIFALSNESTLAEKRCQIKQLRKIDIFNTAVRNYVPKGMNKRKTLVASLFRMRLYGALSLLYTVKNRN